MGYNVTQSVKRSPGYPKKHLVPLYGLRERAEQKAARSKQICCVVRNIGKFLQDCKATHSRTQYSSLAISVRATCQTILRHVYIIIDHFRPAAFTVRQTGCCCDLVSEWGKWFDAALNKTCLSCVP